MAARVEAVFDTTRALDVTPPSRQRSSPSIDGQAVGVRATHHHDAAASRVRSQISRKLIRFAIERARAATPDAVMVP